ncbi:MAG: thioredoxin-like domain-containing protein [Planctomycetota bacterium]
MYPHERSLVKKLEGKPFALIGVNSDSDLGKLKEVIEKENISWRSFWNGPDGTRGPISTQWNVSGWPTIYVLDHKGVIRQKNVRGPELEKVIEELVAEAVGNVKKPASSEGSKGD